MAYIPPVNLPNLQDRDFSRELYGMLSDVGDSYYGARRDKIGDEQWAAEQQRLSTAQALAQSNADRNYALDLQKFQADAAGGPDPEEYYGSPQWYEMDDGSMGFGIISKGGNFKEMQAPDGAKWAPRVTYQDTGTARVPTFTQGGSVAGAPLAVHGSPEPGTVQTSPGAMPGSPGTGVPGLPGGGVPTYEPVGPKATREQGQFDTERRQKDIAAQQALMSGQEQAQTIFTTIDAIGDALDSGWATGIGGRVGAGFNQLTGTPTERSKLDASIETVRALTSRDALISMRLESPTGAAVGNVSDFENRLMAATAGVLDPDRDPEGTKRTLADIKDKWEDFMVAREIAYLANFKGLPPDVAYQALDAIRAGKDPQAVLQRIKQMGGQ